MPTLESLYRQDPESLPFRQPVDPILLGIPVSVYNTHTPTHTVFAVYLSCEKQCLVSSCMSAGLLWHCKESHWPVHHKAEARHGAVPGAVAVCGRRVAHVQQRLVVQQKDVTRLQVLLQAGWGIRAGDWPCHAGPRILLRPEGKPAHGFLLFFLFPHSQFGLYGNVDAVDLIIDIWSCRLSVGTFVYACFFVAEMWHFLLHKLRKTDFSNF